MTGLELPAINYMYFFIVLLVYAISLFSVAVFERWIIKEKISEMSTFNFGVVTLIASIWFLLLFLVGA